MFVSVIHNDLKIPLIKKMHYLKGCLKGDASAVISRMELSVENYETAWELIVQRYDNPQRRLESDLHDLFETEPLTETSVEGISAAMDSVHQLMRSLSKLEDFKDCIFLYALKRRLDTVTKQHWARVRSNTKIPKYEELRTCLTQWISSLETETVRTRKASGSKSINFKSNLRDNKSRVRKELSVNATNITKDVRCLLCKEGHALVKCTSEVQAISGIAKLEETRTDTKIESLFQMSRPKSFGG